MKKVSLILLIFLLPLFLIQPTSAVYGDISPESITSFQETLPDDVLYYPDGFGADILELADYGEISDESYSPDYILTNVKDGSAFNETSATDIEIWFEVDTTLAGFEGFSYAHYIDVDSGTDCDLVAYDFNQDLFVKIDEPLPSSYAWMNGTIYDPDYWNTTHIAFALVELSGVADLYWDYGEITLHRMTLADSGYAESFADVSDWTSLANPIITDGDIARFTTEGDDLWNTYYSDDITGSLEGYYVEFRYAVNDTDFDRLSVRFLTGDAYSGDVIITEYFGHDTTDYYTHKFLISASDVLETIAFLIEDDDGDAPIAFYFDYLRISPANEMGWQHDGSTTEGYTQSAFVNSETDGDLLNLSATSTVQYCDFWFDTTDTKGLGDVAYYPFFEAKVVNASQRTLSYWIRVYQFSAGVFVDVTNGYTDDIRTWRVNLQSELDDFSVVRVYIKTAFDWVQFDYMKIYSIANFTVSQHANTHVTDVVYVDTNNALVFEKTSSVYFSLNYDPVLSVASTTYNVLNLTISGLIPSGSDYDWGLREFATGNRWTFDETRWASLAGTLDAFTFNAKASLTLSAIKFIDTRDWQDMGELDFVIPVGWSAEFEFGYDAFFIFLGLVMIVVSTMYLVRGGKDEISSDKFFYFLILFVMGWAFFVGGIMP